MKKTIILALALALLGGVAYANFGARDTVPSATLLVPYIVVDMNGTGSNATPNVNGYTTLTVVTNVSSAAQIIHVSVYNAASQGVVDFDEILSGYDVWQINWRDLLTGHFELFDTGSAANPPGAETPGGNAGFWNVTDTPPYSSTQAALAPTAWGPTANYAKNNNKTINGLVAPWDIDSISNVSSCGFYPHGWGSQIQYAGLIVSGLQSPLISWPNQDTDCNTSNGAEIKGWGGWLSSLGQQPLFFYAIIDSVSSCSGRFADDPNFWQSSLTDGGIANNTSYLTNNNTLTGYDFYMNSTQNYSESLPTVNLEAMSRYSGIGFYSELRTYAGVANPDLFTAREPLPTAWAFNFMNNSGITTEVAVWKNYTDFEYKTDGVTPLYVTAVRPYIYYAFDQSENSLASTQVNCPSGTFCLQPEPNVFPFQTQKVPVTPANFDGLPTTAAGNFGWMLLVFDPSTGIYPFSTQNVCSAASVKHNLYDAATDFQSYVFAKYNYGTYSTSVEATAMSSPNVLTGAQSTLPVLNTYNGSLSQ
jgi:hypothetical protein